MHHSYLLMKIFYWGPITPKGKPNLGGFEAANRKNIDKLRELGVDVEEIPYPKINRALGFLGKLAYLKLFLSAFTIVRKANKKDTIVHTTPLYGNLLLPSLVFLKLAKLRKIHVLVDVRAGSLIYYYKTKGAAKRKHLRSMLLYADKITVESKSYINDIKYVMGLNLDILYFPNLAICDNNLLPTKSFNTINVFYFGRININKGIDILLDMIKHLDSHYRLYLAGPIANDVDMKLLNQDKIIYIGMLTPNQLKNEMKRMHFFVFPTRHIGEGQSNSLIEAMANGLVPIVSNQGFNAEVVSDCGIVMKKDANGIDYASAIKKIDHCLWENMSHKCYEHIRSCHNIDIEIPKLISIYNQILDNE